MSKIKRWTNDELREGMKWAREDERCNCKNHKDYIETLRLGEKRGRASMLQTLHTLIDKYSMSDGKHFTINPKELKEKSK